MRHITYIPLSSSSLLQDQLSRYFSLLKDGNELMQEILLKLGISTEYNVHLEYNIHSSQTDAMIISSNIANAIEVKWTEPKEKTVGYYKKTYHYSDSVFQYWVVSQRLV